MLETTEATQRPPARLFCALSQNKGNNIVIRRGPSRQVALFKWDRRHDTFELGQWLKGRIYSRRLDISPDGRYVIYFAMGRGAQTWTAVSMTPYLKAIDFYPMEGTWHGGGLFLDDRSYVLNGSYEESGARKQSHFTVEKDAEAHRIKGIDLRISYTHRLLRSGWSFVSNARETGDHTLRFDKPYSKRWILRKCIGPTKRPIRYDDEEYYELIRSRDGLTLQMRDWEWADVDGDTIIWAEHGCLYRAHLEKTGELVKQRKLHDFNDYKFEERAAPY